MVVKQDKAFLVEAKDTGVWSQPSLWISLCALLVSVLGLLLTVFDRWWGVRKDQRARRQSIQADFWLRTVLFPSSLEPAITFANSLATSLPAGSASELARVEYFCRFQDEHRLHFRNLLLVVPLWPQLYEELAQAFEAIEDAVADFCNLPDGSPDTVALPARTQALDTISSALATFVAAIRNHQQAIE